MAHNREVLMLNGFDICSLNRKVNYMKTIKRESLDIILENNDFASEAQLCLDNIYSYADCVIGFADNKKLLTTLYSGDDYREDFMKLDRDRTNKHNAAITGLRMLNRISDALEIDPVYTGDAEEDSRGDIAHAIFEFCKANLDSDSYGKDWK